MYGTGRVDSLENDNYELYKLFKEEKAYVNASDDMLKSIHLRNELSDIFFSRQNLDYLQEAMRYLVYKRSCGKHVIDKQSETELVIVMRSVYLEHGKYRPNDIKEQVKELNVVVLNYCVDKILEEISMYIRYKKDITQLPMPLDRGEFISSKGTKVLEQRF